MRAVRKRLTRERGGVRYARCSPGAAWPCTPRRPGSEPGRGPGPLHAKRASLTVWKPCQRITLKMVQSCCSYSFDNKSKINITLWRWRRAIGKKKAPNVAGALVRNAVYLDIFHSEVTLGFEGPQEWLVGQLDSECVVFVRGVCWVEFQVMYRPSEKREPTHPLSDHRRSVKSEPEKNGAREGPKMYSYGKDTPNEAYSCGVSELIKCWVDSFQFGWET